MKIFAECVARKSIVLMQEMLYLFVIMKNIVAIVVLRKENVSIRYESN